MKVLITADAVGGIWQYVAELADALPAQGIYPVVAVLGPAPSAAQRAAMPARIIETGQPLDWLSAGAATVREAAAAVAHVAAAERVDCVQLNSPALAGAIDWGVPVVAVAHGCGATWWAATRGGALDPALAWQRDLMRAGLIAADRTIAPTAAHAMAVARTYDVARPTVVHNGRTAPGLPTLTMQDAAFTAGRLWDDCKRTALLDRVAAALPLPFHAAGPVRSPTGEVARLDALVPLGTLDDAAIAERLRARPIFVSAAVFEPFGLAVLEAAAAGCALVLADTAGFRELWDGAALFVRPDDERGFARAIASLAEDRGHRIALGERARMRAARYTPDATASGMAAIFRGLAPAGQVAA